MRLKSLEIHGFKSFPDKTTINFDSGMTVIVGPNGSGKSNISDAMRWVLGELSSKNIRGTKMEDVIFGGSATRSPMGYAEVSLIIDNTGDGNRIDIDYDEVEVTRRYYRSGESEYMINRRPARLKDIHEMFMNTGVGKTGYSIVSQGKAAEIISQKSDERRNIFEEAAGISKYRYKKNEAERKLNSTNENLVRLNDIKFELEGRIGPLEKEAEKARKYLDLYEKKKSADISLWLYDTKELREKLKKSEDDFIISGKELEITDETIESLENQSERLFLSAQENKIKSEKNNTELQNANERRYGYEGSLKVLDNDIEHLKQLKVQSENELSLRDEEIQKTKIALEEARKNFEQLQNNLLLSEKERHLADTLLENALLELVELEKELEQTETIIKEKEDEVIAKQIELSSLSGSRKSEDERYESLKGEIKDLEETVTLLKERSAKAEKTIEGYRKKTDEAENNAKDAEKETEKLDSEIKEINDKLNSLYVDMASKKQRADALTRMEEHFEGYANSVRFVMNESLKNNLSGIYGPVSKLISVNKKYTVAIETALGGNLQNIVVKDDECAKKAIALLKEKNAGRATFYPITSIQTQKLNVDLNTVSSFDGYVGVASELTECDDKFRIVSEYLLGRTIVFDNINNASVAAKKLNYKVRLVTLDGQLINAGGSYTGGSTKKDSGMLTRSFEIEKLRKECESIKGETEKLQSSLDMLNKEKEKLSKQKDSHLGNASLLTSLLNAENTQYEVLKSQITADEKNLSELRNEMDRLEKSDDFYNQKKQSIEESISQLELLIASGNDEHEKQKKLIVEKNEEIESLRERNSASVIRLTEDRKDVENLQRTVISTEELLVSLEERITLGSGELESLNIKEQNAESRKENIKKELDETLKLISILEKDRGDFAEKNDEYEQKINELRLKIKEKTNSRELILRTYTKLESLCQQLKNDLDKSSERIWDEYELTYTAALELTLPTVTQENRNETFRELTEYKNKLRALGHVNVSAVDEYKEVKERYDFMHSQISDLEDAEKQLTDIIVKLEVEMRDRFSQAMKDINIHFKNVFRELFGGGTAELVLTNPDDVLTSGIDINVAPPGKIIKNLVSLSGGEQAFVAIALFFAILKVNPTPFCIFDEIESALDEVNVVRFAEYARKYSDATQFIMITHRRGTMESADTLYGVTMYEKGISKVLTVNVRDIEDKLGVKLE
ncbi:MAG: chromosome segregation protein SMC [Ruminococcaceae bacterium]|nr:chromosome segregation protein SMC [Oscillospiraceae bacterium]